MYLIYIDECGYHPNWSEENAIDEQPVYVVSAVAIPAINVAPIYREIQNRMSHLQLPEIDTNALGKGQEIKAKAVDRGEGFWGENPEWRNKVREIYLGRSSVTYFVVCIDKRRHHDKYPTPEDPANLGLKYLLERVQGFLNEQGKQGFIIIDANTRIEPQQRELLRDLLLEGSWGIAISRFYGIPYEWHLKMENVIEIHFGDSKDSLGLQIADFVARCTYSWWKSGKQAHYPGWGHIEPKLWKYPYYKGWGYKEFPE